MLLDTRAAACPRYQSRTEIDREAQGATTKQRERCDHLVVAQRPARRPLAARAAKRRARSGGTNEKKKKKKKQKQKQKKKKKKKKKKKNKTKKQK